MLERLASLCFRKRWIVLFAWIAAFPIAYNVANTYGGEFDNNQGGSDLPDIESQKAFDLLSAAIPQMKSEAQGMGGEVVFYVPTDKGGVASQREAIEAFLESTKSARTKKGELIVKTVRSPFFEGAPMVSQDGTVAVASMTFTEGIDLIKDPTLLLPLADGLRSDGVITEFGGAPFENFTLPPSEVFGIAAAIAILLIAFGSLIAMGLPILTAMFGVGLAIALVQLATRWMKMPDFVTSLSGMIGLGVGIDYVLFIVTRYREELKKGKTPHDATVRAIDTSGRAVLFAGITVMISMLGMLIMGLGFVNGIAIAGALPVAVIVLVALTLIPAMLGFIGPRINSKRQRARLAHPHGETVWHRWSRFVQRNAWVGAGVGVVFLALLSIPYYSIRLGFSDLGNGAESQTTRRAYDLKAQGFGAGSNGPLLVVVDTAKNPSADGVQELAAAIQGTEGVAYVLPINPATAQAGAVLITVMATTGPQDPATTELVHRLRTQVIPSATDLRAYVGGFTAMGIDFSDYIAKRLPVFIGSVLLLSFALLLAVFRSILVPLKAVIMNLLSIGASYGAIVWIFQQGHLGSLLRIGKPGPIEPWIPMLMFAIVFGLSMDYEVFLLSKIREEYDRFKDNSVAVVEGLASTGRLITAAAAIMVSVFLGFVMGQRQIKLMGLGLAIAVFLDATIVRMLIVPATMELLGERNWWFPKWLERLVPRLSVEGHVVDVEL